VILNTPLLSVIHNCKVLHATVLRVTLFIYYYSIRTQRGRPPRLHHAPAPGNLAVPRSPPQNLASLPTSPWRHTLASIAGISPWRRLPAQHPDRGPESAWDGRASMGNPLPVSQRKGWGADSGGWKEAARPRPHQLRRVLPFSAAACASVPSPSAAARASSASPHRFHQPSSHAATSSSSSQFRVGHA
jgi:hypothetical protein